MQNNSEDEWSDWIDYNRTTVLEVPDSAGVFMAHTAMKILVIDNSDNLREKLSSSFSKPCISGATRFRYLITADHEQKKHELLEDFKKRHEGKLPKCM